MGGVIHIIDRGRKIIEEYKCWTDNEDTCEIYASLKTWEREEHFRLFETYLEKTEMQVWEIIIEGPIQLYLSVGRDKIFIILKLFTLEHIGEFFIRKNQKELSDLEKIHNLFFDKVKESETIEAWKLFTRKSLEFYRIGLVERLRFIRNKYPTDDLRRKFILRFESEELFKNR